MTQPSLLDEIIRTEKPWKVTTRTSRAAWLDAEMRGQLSERQIIVGKALKYHWNRKQRSVTSKRLAQWIRASGRAWIGREWSWILLETRRGLDDLRRKGLADRVDVGRRELAWRHREAGSVER